MKTKKREAEPMSKTTLRLPEKLIERAKIRAIKEKRTLQDIAMDALESYLKNAERKGGEQ